LGGSFLPRLRLEPLEGLARLDERRFGLVAATLRG
jgi:hypothetical protein